MTATEKLHQAMAAARQGMANNVADLKRLGREADRRHDQVVERMKQAPATDEHEEVRAGLAAAGNYCRAMVEAATGEKIVDQDRHDARDETGKFSQTNSPGHLFRKMIGK